MSLRSFMRYHWSSFRTDKIKAQTDEGVILPRNGIVVIGIAGIFLRNVRATGEIFLKNLFKKRKSLSFSQ